MSNSSRRRASIVIAMLASSSLTLASARVRADADGEAPHAPPNVLTGDGQPREEGSGQGVAPSTSSSITEPTFEAETRTLTWPNVPLLATGSAVFGISYLPAIIGAGIANGSDKNLYVPVAGPWMVLARGPGESRGYKALLGVDGALQGLGALMVLTSFMIPERVTEHWYLIGANDLRIAPSSVGTGYGLGGAGRF